MGVRVGVIGATGTTGGMVVEGLLSSSTEFVGIPDYTPHEVFVLKRQSVISFTREASIDCHANQKLKEKGVKIVGYNLDGPQERLVEQLKGIDVPISCITWEHLHLQLPWIEAAKKANVKRFVPSEWVGPAPRGIIDIKDKVGYGIALGDASYEKQK
jgi:hypothetical protein